MYAFTTRKLGVAHMIFRVSDNQKAVEVLNAQGFKLICQEELADL